MEVTPNNYPSNNLFLQQLKSCTDNQIKNPDETTRLTTFRLLNTRFKLITLDDRFGDNSYKKAIEKEWQIICQKRGYVMPTSKNRCGIPTGKINNLLVVDVDDLEIFKQLLAKHNIPCVFNTFIVQTGKGYHLYFLYPNDGREYRNVNRAHIDGFDVRGEGGYVLAPGSLHPVSRTVYEVVCDHEIAPIPPKLLEALYEHQQNLPEVNSPPAQTVASLDISARVATLPSTIQELIFQGKPKGERSQASWKVLLSLLSHGFSDIEIHEIYGKYAIGDKARERVKDHWLENEIVRAKKKLVSSQSQNPAPNISVKIEPVNITKYSSVSANTLINYSTKQQYLIETFLPLHGQLIIHGKAGTFKTHLSLQIAVALLNPNETIFLNTFPINDQFRPKKIVILNGENSASELSQKLSMIQHNLAESEKSAINDMIRLMSLNDSITFCGSFDDENFVEGVDRIIKENEAELLIIDNLQCYNENDENDNTKMRQLLNRLTKIKSDNGITLILIHHSGKGDAKELRGASSIKDWASNIVYLEETKDYFELHNTKNRSSMKFPTIKLKFDGNRLVLADPNKGINNEDIVTSVMKQQPLYVVESQDKLIKLIQSYSMKKNNNLSIQVVKKMIEDAVTSGKLNMTKGNANSNVYKLIV